jgi:hypothetical protein
MAWYQTDRLQMEVSAMTGISSDIDIDSIKPHLDFTIPDSVDELDM